MTRTARALMLGTALMTLAAPAVASAQSQPGGSSPMQVHAMAAGQVLTAMPLARQRVESVGIIEGQVHLRAADGSTLKQQDVLAFL